MNELDSIWSEHYAKLINEKSFRDLEQFITLDTGSWGVRYEAEAETKDFGSFQKNKKLQKLTTTRYSIKRVFQRGRGLV